MTTRTDHTFTDANEPLYYVYMEYDSNVQEYYVKRNTTAWFGRPVRVHVYGFTWNPQWISPDTQFYKQITGDWSHHQWVFLPRNSYAVFVPNYVNASYVGGGYCTTFYEVL
jgi:hypothetical protein